MQTTRETPVGDEIGNSSLLGRRDSKQSEWLAKFLCDHGNEFHDSPSLCRQSPHQPLTHRQPSGFSLQQQSDHYRPHHAQFPFAHSAKHALLSCSTSANPVVAVDRTDRMLRSPQAPLRIWEVDQSLRDRGTGA